jgi:molecular chaperone DnaK (HSP70)
MENFGESTSIGVGIDFGTSNSCSGVYINGSVKLVPNKLGERITP